MRLSMQRAIPYYRVSTERQGKSGLGLDAQRQAVEAYARSFGLELDGEFIEVESGRKDKRPVLAKALKACRKLKAILLIAKLDRLGRNVSFIADLMDADIDFRAVDNPSASRFVLHILAAVAEYERDQIAQRTKAALQAAKARGVILGRNGREVLSKANRESANEFALKMEPILNTIRTEGFRSVRKLTKELNRRRIKPYSGYGAKWHTRSVYAVLKRIEALNNH